MQECNNDGSDEYDGGGDDEHDYDDVYNCSNGDEGNHTQCVKQTH